MVIVRSGKTSVLAIRSTGLQEVQRTDSRAHDPLMHTLQRARERSILFIRKAEAHDPQLVMAYTTADPLLTRVGPWGVACVQPTAALPTAAASGARGAPRG